MHIPEPVYNLKTTNLNDLFDHLKYKPKVTHSIPTQWITKERLIKLLRQKSKEATTSVITFDIAIIYSNGQITIYNKNKYITEWNFAQLLPIQAYMLLQHIKTDHVHIGANLNDGFVYIGTKKYQTYNNQKEITKYNDETICDKCGRFIGIWKNDEWIDRDGHLYLDELRYININEYRHHFTITTIKTTLAHCENICITCHNKYSIREKYNVPDYYGISHDIFKIMIELFQNELSRPKGRES